MSEKKEGGDIHITNNYYAPIGQHIDHVDTINFRMDGDGTFHFGHVDQVKQMKAGPTVPEKLSSDAAKKLLSALVDAGKLTDDWQPNNLSGTERGLVAKIVCERLGINDVWQTFGLLWDEKPETLRSYMNKALDQKKTLQFQQELKNILG